VGVGTTVGIWTVGVGTVLGMGSVRTTDPGWLAATTPVPSPKRWRRVSARLFGRSSIEVARRARFPTLIRHEVRLPHLALFGPGPMSSFSLLSWQKRTRAALAYPFVQRAEMPLYPVKMAAAPA
jgi:hypothetical protein